LFLSNFAINGNNHNSDILKKAIIMNIDSINIAIIIHNHLDQELDAELNTAKDIATHIAKINSCMIDIVSGHI